MWRWLGYLVFIYPLQLCAQPVCAKGVVQLHRAPNSQSQVTWRVSRFMPFLKIEAKNGWAKLQDLDGEIHWAKISDLNTKDRCVVVKTATATLRQQPTDGAPVAEVRSVDRYTPFRTVESNGEWIEVEDEVGHKAWIHENSVWKPIIVSNFSF